MPIVAKKSDGDGTSPGDRQPPNERVARIYEALGDWGRQHRRKQPTWTQIDRELGFTPGYFGEIMTGKKRLQIETTPRIAAFLGVRAGWLMWEELPKEAVGGPPVVTAGDSEEKGARGERRESGRRRAKPD